MNITPTSNTANTNFKAVNIVQIPKRAFSNPENLKTCQKEFSKALDSTTGDKLNNIFGAILALFTTKPHKTGTILEKPTYNFAKTAMQKNGINYSLSWLSQNTGIPIGNALKEGVHSFYVFTKEDKQGFMNALSKPLKHLLEFTREGLKRHPSDKKLANIYAHTKYGNAIEEGFNNVIGERKIPQIKIETLEDLPKIIKDLDV